VVGEEARHILLLASATNAPLNSSEPTVIVGALLSAASEQQVKHPLVREDLNVIQISVPGG